MAKPIEPTPILEGKDAENLLKEVDSASYDPEKEKFLKECKQIFDSTNKKLY